MTENDLGVAGFHLGIPDPILQILTDIKEKGTWERLEIRDDKYRAFREKMLGKDGTFFVHYLAEDGITGREAYLVVEISD